MRIGFDFDGVICLTPFGRLAVHPPGHVDPLPPDVEALYAPDRDPGPLRLAIEYVRFAWRQPSPEASGVLRELAASHELYIITGRSRAGIGLVRGWLRRRGLEGCFRDIRMSPGGLRTAQHKLATARMLGIDAHIDDDPLTAYYLADNGVRVFLFDHANARGDAPLPANVTLVASLAEFAAHVRGNA
jgi:uncharacterized HAD superfamily protein